VPTPKNIVHFCGMFIVAAQNSVHILFPRAMNQLFYSGETTMRKIATIMLGGLFAAIASFVIATPASAQYFYVPVYAPPPPPRPVYVRAYPVYPVYPYGYVYNPRRAYRQAVRYGYVPAAVVVTRGPTDFYGRAPYGSSASAYPTYGNSYYSARPSVQESAPAVPLAPAPAPAPTPAPAIEAIPSPPAEVTP
jgi:hypothetical protein